MRNVTVRLSVIRWRGHVISENISVPAAPPKIQEVQNMKRNIRQTVVKTLDGNSYRTHSVTAYECELGSGVVDKNGKEIFEGDIVRTPWNAAKVTFESGAFYVEDAQLTKGDAYEVIGHAED